MTYDPATAALLLAHYNPFLSEGGKMWPRLSATAQVAKALDHTSAIRRPPTYLQDFRAGEALKPQRLKRGVTSREARGS